MELAPAPAASRPRTVHDPSGLHFLIAAKQSEIGDLVELTRTADLMQAISALVHELQRERGLTNLVIASGCQRFVEPRRVQMAATDAASVHADARLARLDPQTPSTSPAAQGSRLYARIAQALQAHAAIAAIRRGVDERRLDAAAATRVLSRIVSAWLAVVFEAADVAADPDISPMLVALFHLMQAKEEAGQERAAGSALFAAGTLTEDDRLRLLDLIEAQARSLEGFAQFAQGAAAQAGQAARSGPQEAQRQRLRRMLQEAAVHGALNPAMSLPWFEACTACMDALKSIEDILLAELRHRCVAKCATLEHELSALFRLAGTAEAAITPEQALAILEAAPQAQGLQPSDRSLAPQVLALVQSQAQRLQRISAELDAARSALQERKQIERAKGLLMAQAGLSEEEAHQALRRRAMEQGLRLSELAAALLQRAA